MTSSPLPQTAVPTPPDQIDWDLIALARRILAGLPTILLSTLAFALLGLALCFYLKPYFTAQAVFLPPKTPDSALGGGSAALLFGGTDLSDTYLGLAASRTVADDVIEHVGLIAIFHAKTRTDARAMLAAASKFSVSKNSLINVEVTSPDPELAARIANAYLDALYRLNGQMVDSASEHRKEFFEDQLAAQKKALVAAELDFKRTQERTGVLTPAAETQAALAATANLQSQINAAQTRLAGLRVSETEQNPEYIEARSQLAQLQSQLGRQESSASNRGRGIATTGELPGISLEYVEKEREVKLREGIYDSVVQQYERARLAAIDPGPQLQTVDRAIPPEHKAGPHRAIICIGFTFLGFLLGLSWVLLARPARNLLRIIRQPQPRRTA